MEKVLTNQDVIITSDGIYAAKNLSSANGEFEFGSAYIDGDYFYPYRGDFKKTSILPGLYLQKNGSYITLHPSDEIREDYLVETHLSNLSASSIQSVLKDKEVLFERTSGSGTTISPPISKNDNVLKRAMKAVLQAKGITLRECRDRFRDKNSLFNFLQCTKSKTPLSMKLFERGCDALNLTYSIIIEEDTTNETVGNPLSEPIVISSNDYIDEDVADCE